MNWDARFASIVKETEQSLARVKSQLQMPLTSGKSGATTQNYSSLLNSPMNTKPGILKSSLGKPSLTSTGLSHRRRSVSFDLGSPTRLGKDGGGAVMSLLTTRLKDQQKEILDLHESIFSLQRSVDRQERQLSSLQTEIKKLQTSRSTNTSIQDSQLQQFKQEVRKELSDLRNKLTAPRAHGTSSPLSDYSVQTVAHELHTSKRLLRGDIESLQEGVSSLKSKLRDRESEVGVCSSGVREVERKQERLEKRLSRLEEQQAKEEAGRARHSTSLHDCSTQLQRMRHLMTEIQSRLVLLEHKSSLSDSTLLPADLDPPSPRTYNGSATSSSPLSKSLGSRSHSSSSRTLFSSRGSGNNNTPFLTRDLSVRSSHGLSSLRESGETTASRPTTARSNPLHTSPLWGQSSGGGVSDDEDTLDGVSILSSESGGLDHELSYDLELGDLSPSTSFLSVGAL